MGGDISAQAPARGFPVSPGAAPDDAEKNDEKREDRGFSFCIAGEFWRKSGACPLTRTSWASRSIPKCRRPLPAAAAAPAAAAVRTSRRSPTGIYLAERPGLSANTAARGGKTHKKIEDSPMLNLSPSARKELEAYFADKDRQTIRIFLAPGG